MKQITRWLVGAAATLVIGCGGGGGGGGGAAPAPTTPPAATLVSIAVTPGAVTLADAGETQSLTCTATYSDGSTAPVAATWTTSNAGVVDLDAAVGGSTTAEAGADGTADITASFGGKSDVVPVEVGPTLATLGDPGPVYVIDDSGSVLRYPAATSPGTAPSSVGTPASNGLYGIACNRTGTKVYTCGADAITELDVVAGTQRQVASGLPGAQLLAFDASDRLYLLRITAYNGLQVGEVSRIDIATGAATFHCRFGEIDGYNYVTYFAVGYDPESGRDDVPYYCSVLSMLGAGNWIHRQVNFDAAFDPNAAGSSGTLPWAPLPAGTASINGLAMQSSVGIDAAGTLYSTCMSDNKVFRHRDLNGDGDAYDAGETETFAVLPVTIPVNSFGYLNLAVGRLGTVVVHVQDYLGDWTGEAVYWLVDADGSGAATGGEIRTFNANTCWNTVDSTVIAVRR